MDGIGARRDVSGVRGSDTSRSLSYAHAMAGSERDVSLKNQRGESIRATLCLPDVPAPAPAVLLCQGLSGVRNLVMPTFAKALAGAGIASLRFDYAGHGDSEGARGWIDPFSRVVDAGCALAYLGACEGIDDERLGVYGHSYGGPVAVHVAAANANVRALVAISSPGDGQDMLRAPRPAWDWVALKERVAAERVAIARGADPTVVPVSDIFPFSPAFAAAYEKLKATQGGTSALPGVDGLGKTDFYLASVDAMATFRPSAAATRLGHCPTLLINGEKDDTAPIETVDAIYRALPGPKRWLIVPGADHNTLDTDPGLDGALTHATQWFSQYLVR